MKREILYQKIAGTIAWQIKTGISKAGEKLPSLRTISNEYGVSLNTAIQVYYELEKEGFIISRPKSGYIVNLEATKFVCAGNNTAFPPNLRERKKQT